MPQDLSDAVARWDRGEPVCTLRITQNLGEDFEYNVQLAFFELARELSGEQAPSDSSSSLLFYARAINNVRRRIPSVVSEITRDQFGMASMYHAILARDGYAKAFDELTDKTRKTTVRRHD